MVESGKILPYLDGMYFPATKEDVVEYAKTNNAPEDVVLILQKLNKVEFLSFSELVRDMEVLGYEE